MALPEVGSLGFVNHAVTLLRNNRTLQNAGDVSCAQEFFVDPRHKTLEIPNSIQQVLNVWFGSKPERCYFNFRMFLVLQVLHSTEFIELITDKWPRATYDLDDTTIIDAAFGESEVRTQLDLGSSATQVAIIGRPEPDHQQGRFLQSWLVDVGQGGPWGGFYPDLWGGSPAVNVTNLLDGTTIEGPQGTNIFDLHSTGPIETVLRIRFSSASAEIPAGAYTVNALARSIENLPEIEARIRALGNDVLGALFASSSEVALGKTLFEQHFSIQYRLSGILLALVFKLEELRQAGQFVSEPVAIPAPIETTPPAESVLAGFLGGGDLNTTGFVTGQGGHAGDPAPEGFVTGQSSHTGTAPAGFVTGEDG